MNIQKSDVPFKVTIVWNDPPNVMWAAKNLLNNLDLVVTSPTGETSYGNGIYGDEFNPVERVVIDEPMVGVYSIQVIASKLAIENQAYSIVITCGGVVEEALTEVLDVDETRIAVDAETQNCTNRQQDAGPAYQLIRFQLEDFNSGNSWEDLAFKIMEGSDNEVFQCTFEPPSVTSNSPDNRVFQCAACLEEGVKYTAILNTDSISESYQQYVRVASTCSNVFLSQYQQQAVLTLDSEGCNTCPDGSSLLGVLMYANVTDDDYQEYTWYGDAYYSVVKHKTNELVAAGTLLVSDEEADW